MSFLENIIYWLWYYSKRLGAHFPFQFAGIILSILIFANLMFVAVISFLSYMLICNAMEISYVILDSEKNVATFGFLYILVLLYVMLRFNDKRYCKVKKLGFWVLSEKYCILTDYYDKITSKQIQKYRKSFLIYLLVSLLFAATNIILVSYIIPHF